MFLSKSKDKTYLVDTSKNDIKQFTTYKGHNNVVLLWIKTLQNRVDKDGSFIEFAVMHIAIDTAMSEIGSKSIAVYRDDNVIQSQNFDVVTWEDVLPGSNGEAFVSFCRALHNHKLMLGYLLEAYLHDLEAPPNKN